MKIGWRIAILVAVLAAGWPAFVFAQNESDEQPLLSVNNGISIQKDSLFLLNLRFRMQNRIGLTSVGGDNLSVDAIEARVRRLRLRFDGFVLNQKLQYYIQLSFSRADQDLETGVLPQTIRDAVLYYNFSPRFYLGFGQAKLPGNRQRVVSSGNLQFADRSLANALFTLDRDFGLFAYYTLPVNEMRFKFKGSLTTGDGRNAGAINEGLAYTGRVEWLPFGTFTNGGDYSEGDLEREKTLKISIGVGASANLKSARTGGQLGTELYDFRDFNTFIADMVLKYRGWAYSTEYMERSASNPITTNSTGDVRYIYVGQGLNQQLSYCFPSRWELAARYTFVQPFRSIAALERRTEEAWLGGSRYFNGHRIKAQAHVVYRWRNGLPQLDQAGNRWGMMFQVEFGI